MKYPELNIKHPPPLSRITGPDDLATIQFIDGIAEVEVPVAKLDLLPLKHYKRYESPRLTSVMRSIRAKGYSTLDPIICRIGARGRWIVIDGGHRLTAARLVSREFPTLFWRTDLGDITFLLFETARSYSKLTSRRLSGVPAA